MSDELDEYRWLVSPSAAEWLDAAAADAGPLVARADRLRKELSAERARRILQQVELRRRAAVKFAAAERMFFTRVGLEQATDEVTAAYKARRFALDTPVADLCCGIGGDLLALARRGPVTAFDRDPITAVLAEANLRATGLADDRLGVVRCSDVTRVALDDFAAWHLDPDRRPQGRRTTRVELHEPGTEAIRQLLAARPDAAIKLAPAAEVPLDWGDGEWEWISRDRECRQLVAWLGDLALAPGRRRATILRGADPHPVRTVIGTPGQSPPLAAAIDRFVFDPDPAVLAAGLLGAVAAEHGLAAFDPAPAYLTGPRNVADQALACFEVTDVLPMDFKHLKRLLRQRRIGRLEIKKRAAAIDPEDLGRRLQLQGDQAAVLLIAPCAGRITAILAQRPRPAE